MLFSSKKEGSLEAPCTGRAIPLSEIPDEAFASGMLGIGFGVVPTEGKILSPVDGRVEGIAEGKHAYTLVSDDGLDVLVHVGIDTVTLGGAAFSPRVSEGARVRAGECLGTAELSAIREKGLNDTVVVLVTDPDRVEDARYEYGACRGGESHPMRFRIRRR